MSARRLAVLAAILGAGLSTTSCGGDTADDDTIRTAGKPVVHVIPGNIAAQANGNCRWMLRGVKQIGEKASRSGYTSGLELTTEGIARPGLRLIKDLAARQRALEDAAADPRFDAYLDLFDPIIVLGEQRLEAGQAGDERRSKQLQELLTDLDAEQRETAAQAGLRACDVDFFGVVVRRAFG